MIKENKQYYTPAQAAKLLCVTDQLIIRHIKSGKLPAMNLGSGKRKIYRIRAEDIDNFDNIKNNE